MPRLCDSDGCDSDGYPDGSKVPQKPPRVLAKDLRYEFTTVEQFARRHRRGTQAEFDFETWQNDKFNKDKHKFRAFPIRCCSITGSAPTQWLLLVAPDQNDGVKLLPDVGETCVANVWTREKGGTNIKKSSALRVDNECATWGITDAKEKAFWKGCMAFHIILDCDDAKAIRRSPKAEDSNKPASKPRKAAVTVTPAFSAKVFLKKEFTKIPQSDCTQLWIDFELRLSRSTYDAEIGALTSLLAARNMNALQSVKQVKALEYFVTLKPKQKSSLFDVLPHMADPFDNPANVHEKLMEWYLTFNEQQKEAYRFLLGNIRDGICMVPGGPGAGKTFWNTFVAAALQSKDETKKPEKGTCSKSRAKVLYLLDINAPLIDVANKMVKVYREQGLTKYCCDDCGTDQPRSVIRMFCWSYEKSEPTQGYITAQRRELENRRKRLRQKQPAMDRENGPLAKYKQEHREKKDETEKVQLRGFSSSFYTLGSSKPVPPQSADQECLAKTLDEAAAEYYHRHRLTKYKDVSELFGLPCYDLKELRDDLVERVYVDTLAHADFVATTPVTASKFSNKLFSPSIVIFDEAPHARDLSLLISVASFKPEAWILTGDHRQTQAFVKSRDHNEYYKQLRLSVMERAFHIDKNMPSLLINHRAYGNLQDLASQLFYQGKMKPALDPAQPGAIPDEVLHLRMTYIMPMKRFKGPEVSRLLVVIDGNCAEDEQGSSYNEGHETWVMKLIRKLTGDPGFRQAKSTDPGTILVMSPYKAAVLHYKRAIRERSFVRANASGHLVEARTVDTSQGHEADVCIIDLAHDKATEHVEDPHRLCVALTRARQMEIVVMSRRMYDAVTESERFPMLDKIIAYCEKNGQAVFDPRI